MKVGDRVRMRSAMVTSDGREIGWVHGTLEAWSGSPVGLLARWQETGLVTALPNPNVELDDGKRD